MADGAELAVGYISLVPSAKGITAGIQSELGGPLAAAGKSSGAATSASFKKSFKSGLTNLAVGVGVVAGVAAIGASFEDAFATIARGTGATGKTLQGLDASFNTVLKSGSGSMNEVSDAVTTLYQRTGLTGKALDDFAEKEVALAKITKTDVGANLQATTSLFNLYGVAADQQSGKLDVLFHASQVAGVTITQLASDMQTAAPTAKILGLTIDQTASLVANLDKAGLPASRVMQGLATTFTKAAKAGQDPLTVITDLVKEIKAAPTPTAAAALAVTKFGISSRAASVLVSGLRNGSISLTDTLDGGKGILATAAATETLGEKFDHLKNEALVGLEPLAVATLNAISTGATDAIPIITALANHMDVLGPLALVAAAGFGTFKIAVGIGNLVDAVTVGLTLLKAALYGTAGGDAAATAGAEGVTAALGEEAVAADAAAAGTAAAGIAIAPLAAIVAVGAVATGALVKTLYDLAAVSTSSGLNVSKTMESFANSVIKTSGSVAAAQTNINGLAAATEKFFNSEGAAGEQTGASLIHNLGISYADVTKIVLEGHPAIDAYVRSLGLSAVNAGTLEGSLHKLSDSLQNNAKTFLQNQVSSGGLNKTLVATAEKLATAKNGTVDYVTAISLLATHQGTVAQASGNLSLILNSQRQAWDLLTTAIINNTDALRQKDEGFLGIQASAITAKQNVLAVHDAFVTWQTDLKNHALAEQTTKDFLSLQAAANSAATGLDTSTDSAEKFASDQSGLTQALKDQAAAIKKNDPKAITKANDEVAASTQKERGIVEQAAASISGPFHDALETWLKDNANLDPAAVKTAHGVELQVKQTTGLSSALKDQAQALIIGGKNSDYYRATTEAVTAKQILFKQQLIELASKSAPAVKAAILDYVNNALAKVPPSKTTALVISGLPIADQAVATYLVKMKLIPRDKITTFSVEAAAALHTLGILDQAVRAINPNVSLVAVNRAEGGRESTSAPQVPHAAHGLVVSKPTLLLAGENSHTTPEIVSPVALMAQTFEAELEAHGNASNRPQNVFTGPIQSWDDRDLARQLDARMRRAEILAGMT